MEIFPKPLRAPEIYGDFWFNSDPISIGSMESAVVLLEFWDFTSTSCVRSLPYTREWHRRYAEMGLVTIGIHSPRFPFARDPLVVGKAVERLGIRHAVVLDNDFVVWSAYQPRVWPTKFLIDKNGMIRYSQEGEGSYQNFEHAIQSLLSEVGYRSEFPLVLDPIHETDSLGAICYRATPEILAGYQRGTIGNIEGLVPESVTDYRDPSLYIEGRIYLHGRWLCDRNYVKLAEEEGAEGYLTFCYQAREVHAVIKPEGEKKFQVFVTQDNAYVDPEARGEDLQADAEGRSYLLISEPKLYSVVKNREFGEHVLKLTSRSNGFALYAVSFVSSVIPDLVFEH